MENYSLFWNIVYIVASISIPVIVHIAWRKERDSGDKVDKIIAYAAGFFVAIFGAGFGIYELTKHL